MRTLNRDEIAVVAGGESEVSADLSIGVRRGPAQINASVSGTMTLADIQSLISSAGGAVGASLGDLMRPGLEIVSRRGGVVGFRDVDTAFGAVVVPPRMF